MNGDSRAERLATLVAEEGLDQLLVGDLVHPSETERDAGANLRWLTGFTGSSGLAALSAEERLFFTDFRYVERAEREVAPEFERVKVERGLISDDQLKIAISVFRRSSWVMAAFGQGERFSARRQFLRAVAKLGLCHWHNSRAAEASGSTGSFSMIPKLQAEIFRLRDQIG